MGLGQIGSSDGSNTDDCEFEFHFHEVAHMNDGPPNFNQEIKLIREYREA